jgi:thiosulfate reductase cytochrome b subunit
LYQIGGAGVVHFDPGCPGAIARLRMTVIYRHTVAVRVTHWINAVVFVLLLVSGLRIFNYHAVLYWGNDGHRGMPPFFSVGAFPDWLILPGGLGAARAVHFDAAWLLVVNGLVYLLFGLFSGHVRCDLLPAAKELAPHRLLAEVLSHLRLRRVRGAATRRYNVLQKLAYVTVVFVLLPVMVLTGLTMSPAVTAAAPVLFDLFGGRQSARTIHFLAASLLVLFVVVHVLQVVITGPVNNMRAMITGRYAIPPENGQ